MPFFEQFVLEPKVSLSFAKYILDGNYIDNSMHYHSDLEISYIKTGKCIYRIKDIDYEVKAGDIVFLKSFENHYIKNIVSDEPVENLVIMTNPQFIRDANKFVLNNKAFSLLQMNVELGSDVFCNRDMESLFLNMERLVEKKEINYHIICKCEIYEILTYIINMIGSKEENEWFHDDCARIINKVTSYIDENILDKIKLEDMAEMANMNPSYLSSYFKKHVGISITEYILQNRVSLSIKKLQTTKLGIKEIALMCGFNNTANFNKAFRNILGKTPSEIRNPEGNKN